MRSARGSWRKGAPSFEFAIPRPAVVYLSTSDKDDPSADGWRKTTMRLEWENDVEQVTSEAIFEKRFEAGRVRVPGSNVRGRIPKMAVVRAEPVDEGGEVSYLRPLAPWSKVSKIKLGPRTSRYYEQTKTRLRDRVCLNGMWKVRSIRSPYFGPDKDRKSFPKRHSPFPPVVVDEVLRHYRGG